MDWQRWQFELEQQIEALSVKNQYFVEAENRILPVTKQAAIMQLETRLGLKLPDDFVEFYTRFDGLRLSSVWNAYFIDTVDHMLQFPSPTILESPEYQGRIQMFGADGGGQNFCIFFGAEAQSILYLPDALWDDNVCDYSVINGTYIGPKWLAADFSGFLQRILEDAKAYMRDDADWKYMDDGLYDHKSL